MSPSKTDNVYVRVIQENLAELRKTIGDVPEHAKYLIDKYTKDSCCVMCGHPAQPSTVVKSIERSFFHSHISLLERQLEEIKQEKSLDWVIRQSANKPSNKMTPDDYTILAHNKVLESIASPLRECLDWAKTQIR